MKMNLDKTSYSTPMPQRIYKLGIAIVALAVVLGAGLFAYVWFSGGSGQASAPISAPSLRVGGTTQLFRIQPDQSEVRFLIDETLMGQAKTVVGSTRELAGDIAVDFTTPANSVVGVIRINVRTLETDNEFRNRALRGQILQSTQPEFEFAIFTPKRLDGLPVQVTIGQPFSFQIVGDLTVRGTTRETTFEATLTATSHTTITGSATAEIRYTDFGLGIPEAPGVAGVAKRVRLEIDFSAIAVAAP